MRINGIYSFNRGEEVITSFYSQELEEVQNVISSVDASLYKTKTSFEKTMSGRSLFHPKSLNTAYKAAFSLMNWQTHRVYCDYPVNYYTAGYTPKSNIRGAFREMDFVKNRVVVRQTEFAG